MPATGSHLFLSPPLTPCHLPVRLYVCWLADWPLALATEPFATRPQLWAHLCHLVNGMEVTAEMVTEAGTVRGRWGC